jgi:predicted AlkP superfamily phosphohydrolase/phosphomutase
MKRLIIIGIDGMDADFVADHPKEMPNFHRLGKRGYGGGLYTVFPSDSIPSWITIFTGIPPVDHGILDAIDYFKKNHTDFSVDTSVFKGRTFWDIASDAGKKVCIINPFMAYPPWRVNGYMVSGPVFVSDGKEASWPQELAVEFPIPSMGGIVDFPSKDTLGQFRRESIGYTKAQHEFSLELLRKKGPFDVFFSTYLTLDRVQHFYWRYQDRRDPTYPGPNEHEGVVLEFYKLFDRIVGEYMEAAGDDYEIMVVSDHGHGRRCTKVANVNEYLRRKGWLDARGGSKNPLNPRRLVQRLKTTTLNTLDRLDMADLAHRVVKTVPKVRELKKTSFLVDEENNLVFTPRFAGTNPCGGVSINRPICEERGIDYEQLRAELRRDLLDMKDEKTGEGLFQWVLTREEYVGEGQAIEKFPDLVFLLKMEYGTGWDLFGDLVATNPTHRKISGGHKLRGVLYTSLDPHATDGEVEEIPAVHDIAPLVLHTLGLPRQPWMRRVGHAKPEVACES